MGIYYEADRRGWVVRWTENGRRRVPRFADEAESRFFPLLCRRDAWTAGTAC